MLFPSWLYTIISVRAYVLRATSTGLGIYIENGPPYIASISLLKNVVILMAIMSDSSNCGVWKLHHRRKFTSTWVVMSLG